MTLLRKDLNKGDIVDIIVGRVRLSSESIVKIAQPPFFGWEVRAIFLRLVRMAKDVVR